VPQNGSSGWITGNPEVIHAPSALVSKNAECRQDPFSVDPMGQYSNADSETI
jgi:hypothetical protein